MCYTEGGPFLYNRHWIPEALLNLLRPGLLTRLAGAPGEHSSRARELSGTQSMAEMESAVEGRTASVLFAGFRALGLFSNDVPHVVRYNALKHRFYVTTCVGKSFHTYDVSDFLLPLPGNQNCPGIVPLSPPTYLGFPFLPPCLT